MTEKIPIVIIWEGDLRIRKDNSFLSCIVDGKFNFDISIEKQFESVLTSSIAPTSFNSSKTLSARETVSGRKSQVFCHSSDFSSNRFLRWLKQFSFDILKKLEKSVTFVYLQNLNLTVHKCCQIIFGKFIFLQFQVGISWY